MALLTYLLTRKKGPAPVDRKALTLAERERYDAVVKAQKIKLDALQKLSGELTKKLEQNRKALADRLKEIDDETRSDYDRIVGDDDALLDRLRTVVGAAAAGRDGGEEG